MALQFSQTYHGYAGTIPSTKFNIGNTDPLTIEFTGDYYLDSDVSGMTVSLGSATGVSFTVFQRGTMTSEFDGLDYEYVIIDVSGQLYMFLHDGDNGSGVALTHDTTPFVGGNHNPLDTTPYCFTRGSLIKTDIGEIPVEQLKVGDSIATQDNGPQSISWIGKRKISGNVPTHLLPIRIKANALGESLPKRDLLVSPQHRILITDWRAELLFGEAEVLVAAKHLVNDHDIRVATDLAKFEYYHIMFDSHQTVISEGLPTESFHPGDFAMQSLSEASRSEILELFPELANNVANYGPITHTSLKAFEAKAMQNV